jgi:hypothetical protein
MTHSLKAPKAPGDPTLEAMKCKTWFQSLQLQKCNVYRYSAIGYRSGGARHVGIKLTHNP